MRIAVLALQGAFIEHEAMLHRLGVETLQIRQKSDLEQPYDGLILPGGESTVQGKLLRELGLFEPLKEQIAGGLPVLATCAGTILLASNIEGQDTTYFKTIPMTVRRNAYGRQLGSFRTTEYVQGIGEIPLTFIRAPYIAHVDDSVDVICTVDDHIVGVQYGNQIAVSFHPELDQDDRIHKHFLELCCARV